MMELNKMIASYYSDKWQMYFLQEGQSFFDKNRSEISNILPKGLLEILHETGGFHDWFVINVSIIGEDKSQNNGITVEFILQSDTEFNYLLRFIEVITFESVGLLIDNGHVMMPHSGPNVPINQLLDIWYVPSGSEIECILLLEGKRYVHLICKNSDGKYITKI